jgi:glycosyltransferase involved in cell wall biosynthesis
MITQFIPGRLKLIEQSVASYIKQSYARRELLVLTDDGPVEESRQAETFLSGLSRSDIRLVRLPGKKTLGELRNQSLQLAQGEIVCQWDDDDLSHPRRLERQLAALINAKRGAIYLRYVVHVFSPTHEAVLADWSRSRHLCHPGSMMAVRAKAKTYPETGSSASKSEDAVFLSQFRETGELGILNNDPYFFTYTFHGTNTWALEHHQMLAAKLGVGSQELEERRVCLQSELDYARQALGDFKLQPR